MKVEGSCVKVDFYDDILSGMTPEQKRELATMLVWDDDILENVVSDLMRIDYFRKMLDITNSHNEVNGLPTVNVEDVLIGNTPLSRFTLEDLEFMKHLGIGLEDLQ